MDTTLPTTIDEVLRELDRIIDESIVSNDARGIFAYVYRRTTAEIKAAIDADEFSDNRSLEEFDVAFANYYIIAYRQYGNGEKCSRVWEESFDGCKDRLTAIQHILLGMNAHINLDLGLTTAAQARGKDIRELEADFLLVNAILARIINDLQNRLARISPLFFLLDWIGKNRDEEIINFSMEKARAQAWNLAISLHNTDDISFQQKQEYADQAFALFAKMIRKPNSHPIRWLLSVISYFEEKDVGRLIEKMKY